MPKDGHVRKCLRYFISNGIVKCWCCGGSTSLHFIERISKQFSIFKQKKELLCRSTELFLCIPLIIKFKSSFVPAGDYRLCRFIVYILVMLNNFSKLDTPLELSAMSLLLLFPTRSFSTLSARFRMVW